MTSDVFHVGNGAGFSGDRVDAPGPVVETLIASGRPAAFFLEVLGERTVALAQLERRRDPSRGYEPMLERLLDPVLARCARHGISILGNFGGANPPAAAALLARMALRHDLPNLRIAVVEGDDVRDSLDLSTLDVHEADATIGGVGMVRWWLRTPIWAPPRWWTRCGRAPRWWWPGAWRTHPWHWRR